MNIKKARKFKPIQKMSDDELFSTIRLCADLINRLVMELNDTRGYLTSCVEGGKQDLQVQSCKELLYVVSDKGKRIYKKAWLALFALSKLYGIKVHADLVRATKRYSKGVKKAEAKANELKGVEQDCEGDIDNGSETLPSK